MNWQTAPLLLPGLIFGLTVHEFAHAWSASLLGDDFARRQGRVSLNPLRHLTPLGTLAILLLPFGWGKPVPVNLYNFARPRRDYLLTSLAGPAANVLTCAVCLGLMHLVLHPFRYEGWLQAAIVWTYVLLLYAVVINAMLAVLNLLPVPPLDGSKIWPCIIPGGKAAIQPKTGRFFTLVLVVLLCTGSLGPVFSYAIRPVFHLVPASDVDRVARCRVAGEEALHAGRWSEAEGAFSQLLAIHPRSHGALHGRASARFSQGNLRGALDDIDRAIAIRPLPEYARLRAEIVEATPPHGGKNPALP